jgi:hypothetical protein
LGLGGLGAPALSSTEQDSLHGRFLARANAVNLTEVAEMKILYLLFSTFFFIIQKFWLFETKNGHIIVRLS